MVQARADRADRDAKHTRDFFVGKLVVEPQLERLAQLRCELVDGFAHRRKPLVFGRRVNSARFDFGQRSKIRRALIMPRENMPGDAEEPRPRQRHSRQTIRRSNRLQESFLEQILCGFHRAAPRKVLQDLKAVTLI